MSVKRANVLSRSINPGAAPFFLRPLAGSVACYNPAVMTLICSSNVILMRTKHDIRDKIFGAQ